MKTLIVTANNGLPYVEVCMSSMHNHNFSIYFTLFALKNRVLINPGPGSMDVLIGYLPAWRGIPAAVLQAAKQVADIAVQAAVTATAGAAGTPGGALRPHTRRNKRQRQRRLPL